MAQLIHMRQRIKAVETIKKITHAMRLISMSTHSRLRHKKAQFEEYKNTFLEFASHLQLQPVSGEEQNKVDLKELVLLIGSQKGLCGAFNTNLFKFFESSYPKIGRSVDIISIGKHATDYIMQQKEPIIKFDNFTAQTFVAISLAITDYILLHKNEYAQIVLYSNFARTFFIQKPQTVTLFPFQAKTNEISSETVALEPYSYENDPKSLAEYIQKMLLTITIEELLFESLLAEQSARFLSMDASTRNAENLLIEMKLEYNKTRQAAITRELTELSSSL